MKFLIFIILLTSCFSIIKKDNYNDPTKLAQEERKKAGIKSKNNNALNNEPEANNEVEFAKKLLIKAKAEADIAFGMMSDAELRLSNYCIGDGYLVAPKTIVEYYDKFQSAASVYEDKIENILAANIEFEKLKVQKNIETYKIIHNNTKDTQKKLIQAQKDYLDGIIEELERKTDVELGKTKRIRKNMKEITKISANVKNPNKKKNPKLL